MTDLQSQTRPLATPSPGAVAPVRPRPALVALCLTLTFAVLGTVLILSQRIPGRVAYDQKLYHDPSIRQFASQWPDFDFWHYLSATTPGYHVLMAGVAKYISPAVM